MSYTVLARRYRSSTFDDLIGQEHIARTLKRAIESGRIAHAFLFCGTRGTGKTSSARILAKCLNCESSDKPVVRPCNHCGSCRGITSGDDIDVLEIDAASNTGVDNVRDIIMNAAFGTARSRFKIYIIDEVHMLSKNAFNALLKLIEEPPAHVKFILATTEPEKVLATILSRCQRYDFRNIPTREIAGHLRDICKKENVAIDDDAVLLVAKAGAGSMRDALSLLDRLLSLGETQVTVDMIEQLLGLPKTQLLFNLATAIGSGDTRGTLQQAEAIIAGGLAADALIAALVDHLRNLLILVTCGPESNLVDVPGQPIDELVAQARQFDAIALSQDIAILEELRRSLRTSQAGRALLDATLVRLALAEQFTSIDGLMAGGGAGAAVQKKKSDEVGAQSPTPTVARDHVRATFAPPPPPLAASQSPSVPAPALAPAPPPPQVTLSSKPQAAIELEPDEPAIDLNAIDLGDDDSLPSVGRVWEGDAPSLSTILAQNKAAKGLPTAAAPTPSPEPARQTSNVEPVDENSLPEVWQGVLQFLKENSHNWHGFLLPGSLDRIEDGQAVVRFPADKKFNVASLDRNGRKEALAQALTHRIGRDIGVRFELSADDAPSAKSPAPPPAATPASAASKPAAKPTIAAPPPPLPEAPRIAITQELKDTLYAEDPFVKAIVDQLGGDIVKIEES